MPTTPPSANDPSEGYSQEDHHPDAGLFWLRLSGWLFMLLILATGLAMVLGSQLPAAHTETATVVLPAAPSHVWQILTDLPHQTRWRSDVDGVQPLADRNGLPCWTEMHDHLAVPLCVTDDSPPHRRVVAISDPQLPIQGTWTFTLQELSGNSTRLTVVESRQVPTLLWRFAVHYLHGERTTLDRLITGLQSACPRP